MAETKAQKPKPSERRSFISRVSETAVFIGMILFTSIAVIAVAIAAPVILGLTALAGFISRNGRARRWRSVGA